MYPVSHVIVYHKSMYPNQEQLIIYTISGGLSMKSKPKISVTPRANNSNTTVERLHLTMTNTDIQRTVCCQILLTCNN